MTDQQKKAFESDVRETLATAWKIVSQSMPAGEQWREAIFQQGFVAGVLVGLRHCQIREDQ